LLLGEWVLDFVRLCEVEECKATAMSAPPLSGVRRWRRPPTAGSKQRRGGSRRTVPNANNHPGRARALTVGKSGRRPDADGSRFATTKSLPRATRRIASKLAEQKKSTNQKIAPVEFISMTDPIDGPPHRVVERPW
jgi:hypothetical protein